MQEGKPNVRSLPRKEKVNRDGKRINTSPSPLGTYVHGWFVCLESRMGRLSFPSLSCQRAGGGRLAAAPNSFLGVCGIRSSSQTVCWSLGCSGREENNLFASTGGVGGRAGGLWGQLHLQELTAHPSSSVCRPYILGPNPGPKQTSTTPSRTAENGARFVPSPPSHHFLLSGCSSCHPS